MNEWRKSEHALAYLARAEGIPHRTEGETALLQEVPLGAKRILDLGTGDGRLLGLLKMDRPQAQGVAMDFSPAMLEAVRKRFAGDPLVEVVAHDFDTPLPELGRFDVVVSSFAIHHATDERKRALYTEIFRMLEPGGVMCNLEHVASASPARHERFLQAIGYTRATEDPSNKLVAVETQLRWLREIGFADVDCHWKWLELALLAGVKAVVH